MSTLTRAHGRLHMEGVDLAQLAEAVGTPTYVYSAGHMRSRYARLASAFDGIDTRICYAVKANSNLSVLSLFADLGAGFDIVSGGELQRVLAIGADPSGVVFSGVGKRADEIDFALKAGIGCFNVESAGELERIARQARNLGTAAPVALRVNPDIDAKTHPYISTGLKANKFGVPIDEAVALYRWAQEEDALRVIGIDCHIGSQIVDTEPLLEALDALLALHDRLASEGIGIEHLDLGGGMGVAYQNEPDFDVQTYGRAVADRLVGRKVAVHLEPGRFLTANAGVLLTRVEYLKRGHEKNFAVVDAAMNDLIRPALYQAWHDVVPVAERDGSAERWEVVGPVCESGDFLASGRSLALREGDLLAVASAGAYGFVQASNYNTRPRPAEVLVEEDAYRIVRRRETVRDLLAAEQEALP
jgi:diaminopimelate decarboxylase